MRVSTPVRSAEGSPSRSMALFSFGPTASEATGYLLRVNRLARALRTLGFDPVPIPPAEGRLLERLSSPPSIALRVGLAALSAWGRIRRAEVCFVEGAMFLPAALLSAATGKKVVFDSHCFQEREWLEGEVTAGRSRWKRRAIALANRACVRIAHVTVCVSEEERRYAIAFHRARPAATVVVPNPIASLGGAGTVPTAQREVLFFGDLAAPHNAAAARYICEVLAPALPDVRFHVVGRASGSPLVHPPNVSLPGFVADLSGFLERATLFVAPHSFGSGTKTKVLAALAAGLPVLATPCAAQGIELDLEAAAALRIEDLPRWPEALRTLLEAEEETLALRGRARASVALRYGDGALLEALVSCLRSAAVPVGAEHVS